MLQQTQVKTVLERFYFPFIEAFPDLCSLANATEDEVLKKWEGLGYYTRARNLHKTAKICETTLPRTVIELNALPGIGKSTAHAIASFAYKIAVPILDANVKRILYRIFAIKKASDNELRDLSHQFFNKKFPFEFNQLMMDIGATICKGKQISCEICPLQKICKSYEFSQINSAISPLDYPMKKVKKNIPIKQSTLVIFEYKNRFALYQRETNFLKGLWGFYEYQPSNKENSLCSLIQKYSHFHLHVDVYYSKVFQKNKQYFSLKEIDKLTLSGIDQKIIKCISKI
jgi:A/G-specific adenine glycosylase